MRSFTEVPAAQRTPDWYAARLGRLTGSCAGEMLATIKSGEAAARRNLRLRLVLERLTGKSQESDFVSPAMQAGIDREALAFAAFEALTGEVVWRSGFLSHVVHMAGCSVDGSLGDFDALLSIKCRQPAAHYEFLRHGKIPAESLSQMRHELWITGASEHTYFSWNPDFPDAMQSRMVIVKRAEMDIPEYEKKALAFLAEVQADVDAMATMANPVQQMAAVL